MAKLRALIFDEVAMFVSSSIWSIWNSFLRTSRWRDRANAWNWEKLIVSV